MLCSAAAVHLGPEKCRGNEAITDSIIYWIGREFNGAHLTNKLAKKRTKKSAGS